MYRYFDYTKIPHLWQFDGLTQKTTSEFTLQNIPLKIFSYNNEIMRLCLGGERKIDYGFIIEPKEGFSLKHSFRNNQHIFKNASFSLILEDSPFRFSIKKGKDTLLAPITDSHFVKKYRLPPFARGEAGEWIFSFDLHPFTPVYGFGESHGRIDQRGELIYSYNQDSLGVNSELKYKNIPFFWSTDGWGILIHSPAPITHYVGFAPLSCRSYCAVVEDEVLDLFLFTGSPKEILYHYTELTARAPLVPRWSLGALVSRAYYKTQEEVMDVAKTMREKEFPCDLITLDGRAWQDTESRFAFEWDSSRYPEPKKFVDELKIMGYEVCNWIYPLLSVKNPLFKEFDEKGWFLKDFSGKTYLYEWDTSPFGEVLTTLPISGIYDFTNPHFLEWWKEQVRYLVGNIGVKMLKNDFAEQVPDDCIGFNGEKGRQLHNAYSFLYTKATYEAIEEVLGKGEGLLWGRAAWIGSHRYPIQWAGDSQSDYGGLACSIIGNINYGLSGGAYYTYDIGGFYGEQPSLKQYIRWLQAATFSSHFRYHGIGQREPWHFGSEVELIAREWLGIRYQLIPYIEKCMQQSNTTGLPIVRAMVIEFSEQKGLMNYLQYMFGDDIFVAPITREDDIVTYCLPNGTWYDFFTHEKAISGKEITIKMSIDRIPVFVKEGASIPLAKKVKVNTKEWGATIPIDEFRNYGI